jgi:probable phosphoglycerate mutase
MAGGEPGVASARPRDVAPGQSTVGAGPDRAAGPVLRLVLWRHGQTVWNAERRFQGHSDISLDETGHEQARYAARYLAAMHPDAIFSSDLSRASETAAYLADLTGLPVQLDKDLRERGGGAWEGLTDQEIREGYPEAYAEWIPPDGEPVSAVADRVSAALERVADNADGSLVVLVSHGAAISLGISRLLGLPERTRVLGPLGNCSWSVLGKRWGNWRLLEHNVGRLPDLDPEPVPVLAAGPEEETAPAGSEGTAPGSGD